MVVTLLQAGAAPGASTKQCKCCTAAKNNGFRIRVCRKNPAFMQSLMRRPEVNARQSAPSRAFPAASSKHRPDLQQAEKGLQPQNCSMSHELFRLTLRQAGQAQYEYAKRIEAAQAFRYMANRFYRAMLPEALAVHASAAIKKRAKAVFCAANAQISCWFAGPAACPAACNIRSDAVSPLAKTRIRGRRPAGL